LSRDIAQISKLAISPRTFSPHPPHRQDIAKPLEIQTIAALGSHRFPSISIALSSHFSQIFVILFFARSNCLSFNPYCVLIFTMHPSLLTIVALAFFSAPLTFAFEEVDVNSTVVAGTDTTIQIVNDLSRGPQSFDGMFDSFRVYLSITIPGWGFGPACYLVNTSAINVTSLNVQIPASVGPSDYSSQGYSIATMEFNQDPNADNGPSGFQYSNNFDFVGGTGKWSDYELAGYSVAEIDYVPCSAYDCARQCSQKYYPGNVESKSISAYEPTYNCVAACPGVTYPPFDSVYGDSGSGSGGSSSAGSASTTSFDAEGGFTQAINTATSTTSRSLLATTQASSTSSSSGTSTASSTTSASTPSASKSAASLVSSSGSVIVAVALSLLINLTNL
jgi:hypothetical protein